MHEQNRQPGENPLEDLADELSQALGETPKEIDSESAQHVQAGQVWMRNSAARSVSAPFSSTERTRIPTLRSWARGSTRSVMRWSKTE